MSASTEVKGQPRAAATKGPVVKRQTLVTRITHWVWAICLFFLLLTGLQIFNAHPTLYIGQQSGFAFDNAVLSMHAERTETGDVVGITTLWGHEFDTTGLFGMSGPEADPDYQGFPGWMTIPSSRNLATGRVVHFFFAWVLVTTLFVWLVGSVFNGHFRRDIWPGLRDLRAVPGSLWAHARFRFHHRRQYNPVQKLSYAIVLLVLFPLIILTGLSMSPGMNAGWPWLIEVFGGRQTARTIHFATMSLLVLFFVVHILMVLLAGPINELRSMITGRYRIDPERGEDR